MQSISDIFLKEGYRVCRIMPEGLNVFYRYYQEGFHTVLVLDLGRDNILRTVPLWQLQSRIKDFFYHPLGKLQDFPEGFPVYHVELLTLLLDGDEGFAQRVCQVETDVWSYRTKERRVLIYENQPGDFFGLRQVLENYNPMGDRCCQSRKFPYVTIGLVGINILIYIVLLCMGDVNSAFFMLEHGAVYPENVAYQGEWWRVFTAMFLHFGVSHLLNNMVMLGCMGSRVESVVGSLKMALIYILSGVGGGILSCMMMINSGDYAVSAGASGAVFGMIGAMLWLVIVHCGRLNGISTRGMVIMAFLSLYYGFVSAGVDNWAHLGGLVAGFLLAIILYRGKCQKD